MPAASASVPSGPRGSSGASAGMAATRAAVAGVGRSGRAGGPGVSWRGAFVAAWAGGGEGAGGWRGAGSTTEGQCHGWRPGRRAVRRAGTRGQAASAGPFAAGSEVPRPVSPSGGRGRRLRLPPRRVARSVTVAAVCPAGRRARRPRNVPTAPMLHGNIRPLPALRVPMPRVLLVNDTDKPIAELRQALADAGCEVLSHVSTAGLLRAVQEQQPDVVILDVESPSRDTLEQLAIVDRHAPRPVVMFSADGDERLIREALGAGVAAYV